MLVRFGYNITVSVTAPTHMITQLSVRPETALALRGPERADVRTPDGSAVRMWSYLDSFGNHCRRFTLPAGTSTLSGGGVVAVSDEIDPVFPEAEEIAIEHLPNDVLLYLMGSRYCETDRLMGFAWERFGTIEPGWQRVQAIVDWVHGHLWFNYREASATRTAYEAWLERKGVCRDFAHLAIALCRCLNIPARYINGHLGDIGVPASPDPMDFSAWMEVYLSGRWWTFDPRNNAFRQARIVIAHGRDAADVAMITSFGPHRLEKFEVITDEVRQP